MYRTHVYDLFQMIFLYIRTYGRMKMVESHFSNSRSLEVTYSVSFRMPFEEVLKKKKQSNRLQIENVSTVPVWYRAENISMICWEKVKILVIL